jgi:hypothetical protein
MFPRQTKQILTHQASAAAGGCQAFRRRVCTALVEPRGYFGRGTSRSVRDVESAVIPNAGHFVAEQSPEALWRAVSGDQRAAPGGVRRTTSDRTRGALAGRVTPGRT